jgi:hypothetical protein
MAKELYGSMTFYKCKKCGELYAAKSICECQVPKGHVIPNGQPIMKSDYPELYEAIQREDFPWLTEHEWNKREQPKAKECECGLEKSGAGGKHSPWCPKYEEEE